MPQALDQYWSPLVFFGVPSEFFFGQIQAYITLGETKNLLKQMVGLGIKKQAFVGLQFLLSLFWSPGL